MEYKYQNEFAQQLTNEWLNGDQTGVRTKIRTLKNKAQAAYIASQVTWNLLNDNGFDASRLFVEFIHPNNR